MLSISAYITTNKKIMHAEYRNKIDLFVSVSHAVRPMKKMCPLAVKDV